MTSPPPRFGFYLYHIENPVSEESDIWQTPLPVNRASERPEFGSVSHGDYFSAIQDFLEKENYNSLLSAISKFKSGIRAEHIKNISIILEKHGEFYHPARVSVEIPGETLFFVINAAISSAGRECIKREYELLKRLDSRFPVSFIPPVYARGTGISLNGVKIPMFLGEWFKDYCEFHISGDPDIKNKIVVWDTAHNNPVLSQEQQEALYRQAAMILTCYYDIEAFTHIFPWHHAAGDFIVRIQDRRLKLKLITVRQYAPMIALEEDEVDEGTILEALLIFFLHLSIRMRLDRFDGVGDVAWADDIALKGSLEGFFQGLSLQAEASLIPEILPDIFLKYIRSFSEADLLDTAGTILDTYPSHIPEFPVITKHLKKHIQFLHKALKNS